MKKYVVFLSLFLPLVSFGSPSVRMLGNQPALSAAVKSGARVAEVKSSGESSGSVSNARVGSLSATKKPGTVTSSIGRVSSSSRFPVIQPAYSYNTAVAPQTGGSSSGGSSQMPANVDVAAIIDAVTNNIENNYYNVDQVYNNSDFVTAVKGVVKDVEDKRMFDVVRLSNPFEEHHADAPAGFVYVWIEEN